MPRSADIKNNMPQGHFIFWPCRVPCPHWERGTDNLLSVLMPQWGQERKIEKWKELFNQKTILHHNSTEHVWFREDNKQTTYRTYHSFQRWRNAAAWWWFQLWKLSGCERPVEPTLWVGHIRRFSLRPSSMEILEQRLCKDCWPDGTIHANLRSFSKLVWRKRRAALYLEKSFVRTTLLWRDGRWCEFEWPDERYSKNHAAA